MLSNPAHWSEDVIPGLTVYIFDLFVEPLAVEIIFTSQSPGPSKALNSVTMEEHVSVVDKTVCRSPQTSTVVTSAS